MESLRPYLEQDPLARLTAPLVERAVRERLSTYLPEASAGPSVTAVRRFVETAPWRYWDDDTVRIALEILEKAPERSVEALKHWGARVNRGIENLFRPSRVTQDETSLSHTYSRDLIRIATEFNPEYLRLAEHVFGNLVALYWGIVKKGGVSGKFDIRGAADILRGQGRSSIVAGYDDAVRNAIAHGEVTFTAMHIQYGPHNRNAYISSDYLNMFDQLVRTSNALALALMLFALRWRGGQHVRESLPLALKVEIASGIVGRTGFRVIGAVESEVPRVGRQLHIAVETVCRNRLLAMVECARVAMRLVEAGAHGYSRFLFEVDQGTQIRSLAILLPNALAELIDQDAPLERLPEVFDKTQLLWLDEPTWKWRLRGWRIIISDAFRSTAMDVLDRWHAAGIRLGKGRYVVRETSNNSAGGIARLEFRAVLRRPDDARDRDLVNEILRELVRAGRRQWINASPSEIDRGVRWRKRPRHVFVYLYKNDGTLRWFRSGGWPSGNLVAVGEWVAGRAPPVLVENPQKIHKRIRIRYEMDRQQLAKALAGIQSLQQDLSAD